MSYMYALSWKLLIIGLLWNFCNFTQKTIPEENSCKMFHISSLIVLFLMERSRMLFVDKDQISSGEDKRNV